MKFQTQEQFLASKPLTELVALKAKLPTRIRAAGLMLNPERRQKALDKLQVEWVQLDRIIAAKQGRSAA